MEMGSGRRYPSVMRARASRHSLKQSRAHGRRHSTEPAQAKTTLAREARDSTWQTTMVFSAEY